MAEGDKKLSEVKPATYYKLDMTYLEAIDFALKYYDNLGIADSNHGMRYNELINDALPVMAKNGIGYFLHEQSPERQKYADKMQKEFWNKKDAKGEDIEAFSKKTSEEIRRTMSKEELENATKPTESVYEDNRRYDYIEVKTAMVGINYLAVDNEATHGPASKAQDDLLAAQKRVKTDQSTDAVRNLYSNVSNMMAALLVREKKDKDALEPILKALPEGANIAVKFGEAHFSKEKDMDESKASFVTFSFANTDSRLRDVDGPSSLKLLQMAANKTIEAIDNGKISTKDEIDQYFEGIVNHVTNTGKGLPKSKDPADFVVVTNREGNEARSMLISGKAINELEKRGVIFTKAPGLEGDLSHTFLAKDSVEIENTVFTPLKIDSAVAKSIKEGLAEEDKTPDREYKPVEIDWSKSTEQNQEAAKEFQKQQGGLER